jgi:hypothetical protein
VQLVRGCRKAAESNDFAQSLELIEVEIAHGETRSDELKCKDSRKGQAAPPLFGRSRKHCS